MLISIAQVFRLTYLDFDFFAAITTLSFLILLFSLVLGIISIRWFGRGLSTYRALYYAIHILAHTNVFI